MWFSASLVFFPGACFSHNCYVKTSTPRANWIKLADLTDFQMGSTAINFTDFTVIDTKFQNSITICWTIWTFSTHLSPYLNPGPQLFLKKNRLTCALGNGVRSKNSLRRLGGFKKVGNFLGIVWTSLGKLRVSREFVEPKRFVLTRLYTAHQNQQPNHKVVGLFFLGWKIIYF